MPRRGKGLGFEELTPNITAHELFSNLHAGDRVAITGRNAGAAQSHADALRQRNISARVITGQSDVNDFCFLQSTRRELVGSAKSTFIMWAGFLSYSTLLPVRLYSINSAATRRRHGKNWMVFYNWTHPSLRERFSYEGYEQP